MGYYPPLAVLAGFWIFSPEALVYVGNAAGQGAGLAIAALGFYGVLVLGGRAVLRRTGCHLAAPPGGLADWSVSSLGLAGLLGTTLFGTTGILVSAGFVFNEVFWYRFPNFGFAFLLLLAAGGCQFLNRRWFSILQQVLLLVCGIALALLVSAGLVDQAAAWEPAAAAHSGAALPLVAIGFLFVGFEQTFEDAGTGGGWLTEAMIIAAVMLLCGWAAVSATVVDPDRLAGSTIPHMLAAAAIGGEVGRVVMGTAVICGALAAVNGLFTFSSRFVKRRLLGPDSAIPGWIITGVLALTVGLLLYAGLAGSPRLEQLLRAGLLLWFGYGGVLLLAGAYRYHHCPITAIAGGVVGAAILAAGAALLTLSDRTWLPIEVAAGMLAIAAAAVPLIRWGAGKSRILSST